MSSASSHVRQDVVAFLGPFLGRLADAWESAMKKLEALDKKAAASRSKVNS